MKYLIRGMDGVTGEEFLLGDGEPFEVLPLHSTCDYDFLTYLIKYHHDCRWWLIKFYGGQK